MSDTDTPTGPGPAPFGVRLDAATLARLDAYAERIDKKRGGAAARVLAAGLDALEGLPVRAPANPSREVSPGAALDVSALAGALYDLVGPMLVDAVKGSARGARPSQLAAVGVVGVARVIDAVADLQGMPPEPAPAPAPPVAAELPAEGARIDPATLRAVPGVYVAGWIKRGPNGFIGTNKSCSMQTVSALVDDFNAGLLADPAGRPAALGRLVRDRRPEAVDAARWQAIDSTEVARGKAAGRPRVKFTTVAEMLDAARGSAKVTPWREISRRAAVALRSVRER
jgi:hypothetical protein